MSGLQTLLPVTLQPIGDQQANAVSARDLHAFLGSKDDFSTWFKYQVERARLVEHRDFEVFRNIPGNSTGRPRQEYALTIESAKHIGMMSGTDKGFEVRDYFIECERRAQHPALNLSRMDLIQIAMDAEKERLTLACRVEEMAPKAAFHDQVAASEDAFSIAEFAKTLGTGETRLFRWLREAGYLIPNSTLPYQRYIDQGLFRVVEKAFEDRHGRDRFFTKTLVTGKGQIVLAKVYRAQGEALRLRPVEG